MWVYFILVYWLTGRYTNMKLIIGEVSWLYWLAGCEVELGGHLG